MVFQSTRPVRGATYTLHLYFRCSLFQSTRPVRGATPHVEISLSDSKISIHAPRAGRDGDRPVSIAISVNFNPRAPCGARLSFSHSHIWLKYFNPRAPCGARPLTRRDMLLRWNFNLRAPCGARLRVIRMNQVTENFNPRAPCGARHLLHGVVPRHIPFQSTRPVRGATSSKTADGVFPTISIHAPRAGRDTRWSTMTSFRPNFNPRAPCGARPPKRQ